MTEQNFSEREIKDALENLEAPYDPASWAKLEQRLNAPFTEENPAAVEAVDKLVFPKLARLEPAFNEQHWQIMAARLRVIAMRRRQVVSTKLLEIAIILLVFGNLPAWLGLKAPREQQIFMPKNQAIAELEEASKKVGNPHLSENDPISKKQQASPENGAENPPTSSLGQNFGENPSTSQPEISLAREVFNAISNYFLEKKPETPPAKPPVPIASNQVSPPLNPAKQATGLSNLADFAQVQTLLSEVSNPLAQPFVPISYFFEKKKTKHFQIGVFVAPEANIVRTPSPEYGEKDFVQLVHGYACGLTFGQKKGRFGFETGLIYQAKNLDRRELDVYGNLQDGYVKQLLDRQEFEIMGVPVRATAKIARAKHISVSARAGISANAIVQKNNVRRTVPVTRPAVPGSEGILALQRSNKIEQRGLFEGGSLKENGFFTADAGLRFERPVGGRMSLYFEPVVQHSIKNGGIGLRKDRLTTFSWQVGLTATL